MELTLNVLLWIALAVVAGVVGNAAWDFIKPRGRKALDLIFKIITLNAQKSRDGIYARAAKRDPEIAARTLVLAALAVFVGAVTGELFVGIRKVFADDEPQKTIWEQLRGNPSWAIAVVSAVAVFTLFWLYLLIRLVLTGDQVRFVTTTFDRAMVILRPEISQQVYHTIHRQFALMASEADYRALWSDIRSIERASNVKLPM